MDGVMRASFKPSASSGSVGLFQNLLDRLATRAATALAPQSVEPRLASYLAQMTPRFVAPHPSAYDEENMPLPQPAAEAPGPCDGEPSLAARAAILREKILTARSRDDVRRLRRLGARLLHPDLSPLHERTAAEKIMAELNAAIDAALRSRRAGP